MMERDSKREEQVEGISASIPDWSREIPRGFWDPSRKLLRVIRRYQYWSLKSGPVANLLRKWLVIRHHFWSAITGTDIPITCNLGGGLLLPHPNGIVIHPDAMIGVNCLIFQQVTIGVQGKPGAPVIGGHVDIGAGAKVLGPVVVGDHACVGANAVVLTDIPKGAIAVGIPAKPTLS